MSDHLTRRHALALTLAAPLVLRLSPAGATPETMRLAIEEFTGGAPVEQAAEGAMRLPQSRAYAGGGDGAGADVEILRRGADFYLNQIFP